MEDAMNRKKANKLTFFLEEKGFYIILILCIAAVGVSGYVLFFSESEPEAQQLLQNPVTITPTGAPDIEQLITSLPPGTLRDTKVTMAPSPEPSLEEVLGIIAADRDAAGQDKEQANLGEAVEVNTVADIPGKSGAAAVFVWPINGEILTAFSVDELVFNRTLEDWRVHTGADIAAPLGAEIGAIGDGIIEDVYMSEMMGMTVVIDHGDKMKSVYQNLAEAVDVSIGDSITAGKTIGTVGQTAENESADQPHLHLEVIREGAQLDPMELLP